MVFFHVHGIEVDWFTVFPSNRLFDTVHVHESALYFPVADKKTAIGVVEGNIDEAKELVSNEMFIHVLQGLLSTVLGQ